MYHPNRSLMPRFEHKILEVYPDGRRKMRNGDGLIEICREGVVTIPETVGTTFAGRESWEADYKWRLQPSEKRQDFEALDALIAKQNGFSARPIQVELGSLIGIVRDMLGVEELSYLYADDEDLYREIIDTVGTIQYDNVKTILERGLRPDVGHFWEDICYKNGPLVTPSVFYEVVGPHYKRITDLLRSYGCDIVSLDCDGLIDYLIPTWIENGVNTMFPMEVGTWNASIAPWREKYGKEIRGVGGMNKNVFAADYAAVDREIERLRPLVELGGYIPCPDHRIPLGAKWENIQYYCEQFRKMFQ
jgi:uroporphyrinogen decarboxylase